MALRIGVREIPWYRVTLYLTLAYAVVTLLTLFYRADFLNLTICTVAIYFLLNVESLSKNLFRFLVLGLFFACLYDLIWFAVKLNEANAPDVGAERAVRTFSQWMSYIGFFVRLGVAMVYWKDSLDFENVMLGKKVDRAIRTFSA